MLSKFDNLKFNLSSKSGFAKVVIGGWLFYFMLAQFNLASTANIIIEKFLLCPFQYVTNIECPGCGMTRAFISLAKLNVIEAFIYNPFSIPLFIYLWLQIIPLPRVAVTIKTKKIIKILSLVIVLLWWICFRVYWK